MPDPTMKRMTERLGRLYGEARVAELTKRLALLLGRYGATTAPQEVANDGRAPSLWSERDAVLISYGDMVQAEGAAPLQVLKEFCDRWLRGAINTVHVLPFFPSSSDAGFSVIDYREVDAKLGGWEEIAELGRGYDLMVDLVLNHCSRGSAWFRDYVSGVAPYDSYFMEGDPEADHSAVVRPRPWPLFSKVETARGVRHVWNTFSADQVDLNWRSPDVLFEFLDILLHYSARGARLIRLDAVAFLWKEPGTHCLHLWQTHEVVKLMRDVLSVVAPRTILITETNVPHEENISYFGQGEEAQMVYQFALPPLLLHGFHRNDSTHLQRWARSLDSPPAGATYFNFTASHDGIGVRPLEGLLEAREVDWLVERIRERGGLVSSRSMPDGGEKPYELNITFRDALSDLDGGELGVRRFLCSQALMMSLQGIPAIYFQSVVGARNCLAGVAGPGGENRDINRERWKRGELEEKLDDAGSDHSRILGACTKMLRARAQCTGFHPEARQEVMKTGKEIFAVLRESTGGTKVLCLFNFTGDELELPGELAKKALGDGGYRDLLGSYREGESGGIRLAGYGCAWLVRS